MTYTNKQKADVLRRAAQSVRNGTNDWACTAIAQVIYTANELSDYDLSDELTAYIKPFWNHDNYELFLSTSLGAHLNISSECYEKMPPFFRVAREKMLLAAADAMEKGLKP